MGRSQQLKSIIFKWRNLLAYLTLAAAITYSIGYVRDEASNNREALAVSAKTVIVKSCNRDNDTRTTLRGLILSGIPQTKRLVREGTLTQAQADRQIKLTKEAVLKLPNTDCKKAGEDFAKEAQKK